MTLSSPSGSGLRRSGGSPCSAGFSMLTATTCVTGRSVSAPIRYGTSERSQRDVWPGSVETITSSNMPGLQTSATACTGSLSPISPSAFSPSARQRSSASARRSSSAPWSGPEAGITSLKSTGTEPRLARSRRAASRSSEVAVTVATTSTCAAIWPSSRGSLEQSLRLRERQVDDLRADAVVADGERVAGRRLAPDQRQRDPSVHRRLDDGAEPADLALAEPQRVALRRRPTQLEPAQVAVRLAAEVQPRDRLLADVAALLERHRARVQAGFLRDHRVVEVDPVARPPGLDAADLGVGLGRLDRAGGGERRRDALGVGRVAEHVDAEVGGDQPHGRSAELAGAVRVLHLPQVVGARDPAGVGADQREQPALDRALVQLHGAPELEAPDHPEQVLQRDALAVEQQLVARVEDPQVAEHLALVREEGGVAAGAVRQALHVVRDLAVQELLRLGARQRQLAALGAVDEERVGGRHHSVSS